MLSEMLEGRARLAECWEDSMSVQPRHTGDNEKTAAERDQQRKGPPYAAMALVE